jgi:glycogen debranching enzyme
VAQDAFAESVRLTESNALATSSDLLARVGRGVDELGALLRDARAGFGRTFPAGRSGLPDLVEESDTAHGECRPNQLLAASLPHGPVRDPEEIAGIVGACRAELLTSVGLRSLGPSEPGYCGRHRGGPAERDRAYHQGTVWPWLIGPYTDAVRRAGGDATGLLDGLQLHLADFGLGSVSETLDGDVPHAATGAPSRRGRSPSSSGPGGRRTRPGRSRWPGPRTRPGRPDARKAVLRRIGQLGRHPLGHRRARPGRSVGLPQAVRLRP